MLQHAPARHQRPKPPGSRTKHFRANSTATASTDLFTSPETSRRDDKRRSLALSAHDEEEVDIELSHPSPTLRKSTSMKNIGLGLPSAFATLSGSIKTEETLSHDGEKGPSPPPAYGPLLSNGGLLIAVNTPPTQAIEHDSPNAYFSQVDDPAQELQLRRRRATDAAEAIGLQLDFTPEEQHASDDIDGLGEKEIREQLRIMKRQLDLRDNGSYPSTGQTSLDQC